MRDPDLEDLLCKYEEMLRMRLEDEAHPGGDPRREMAKLAERFPGALREIDEAPLERIRERVDALRGCLSDGALPEPWMHPTARYHRLTRGALSVKRWLGKRHRVGEEIVQSFEAELTRVLFPEDARLWTGRLDAIASPPRGRVTDVVFARLADELGVTVHAARALVLGPTRSRRGSSQRGK
jgi:hypothetical protein